MIFVLSLLVFVVLLFAVKSVVLASGQMQTELVHLKETQMRSVLLIKKKKSITLLTVVVITAHTA